MIVIYTKHWAMDCHLYQNRTWIAIYLSILKNRVKTVLQKKQTNID